MKITFVFFCGNITYVFFQIFFNCLAKSNGKKNAQQNNLSDADIEFDCSVLSSTAVNTENTESNMQDSNSHIVVNDTPPSLTQESEAGDDPESQTQVQKQTAKTNRAPRKRKLRPEEERTLKILAEKLCVKFLHVGQNQ